MFEARRFRSMPKRARPLGQLGEPLVSTTDRAADMLGVDPGRLAAAVGARQLPAWGQHASGAAVYRWDELNELARELGAVAGESPAERRRRQYAQRQQRGRRSRYQQQPINPRSRAR
jgi:hypothetical protein